MTKLTNTTVFRAGKTARTWNHETTKVSLSSVPGTLRLSFSMSSKGGGVTEVQVEIGANDFFAMAATMAGSDRHAAMSGFAAVLSTEIRNQPACDKVVARAARDSVVDLARTAFSKAPAGRNHAERLGLDMVKDWVRQLNESDEAESPQAETS